MSSFKPRQRPGSAKAPLRTRHDVESRFRRLLRRLKIVS